MPKKKQKKRKNRGKWRDEYVGHFMLAVHRAKSFL